LELPAGGPATVRLFCFAPAAGGWRRELGIDQQAAPARRQRTNHRHLCGITERKLAELFWRLSLMVHGRAYVEEGLKKYEEKVAQTEQRLLQKLARKYNLILQPKAA
jgi:hypothetical protein